MKRDPKIVEKMINESLAIEAENAKDAGTLGYMARGMVQATMPHKKTDELIHQRSNGNFHITMMASPDFGLPYGSTPRLMLAWIGAEAVKTKQRELLLGKNMNDFLRELGLVPSGGRWGTITRLKDQSARLFTCSISTYYKGPDKGGTRFVNKTPFGVGDADLWWTSKTPEQAGLFHSTLVLSEQFYNEIIDSPVPVDIRVLKMLKKSPLALDVYCWLVYRIHTLNRSRRSMVTIPWDSLQMQFGSGYPVDTKQGERDFKKAFIEQLKKIHALAYQNARFDIDQKGLTLHKSKPSLPPRNHKPLT